MKKKKVRSLKWKVISIILFYWMLPFLVIIGTIGGYMLSSQRNNQMERLVVQARLNAENCAERLNGAISDSRQATYDRTLYEKYRQYRRAGAAGENEFSNAAQSYLNSQYSHRKNNIFAALMLKEDPWNKRYTCYNFSTGGSYSEIQRFFREDTEKVLKLAEELDTAVGFYKSGDGLYVVRNMVDRNFEPWGVLVNRVNTDYCFEAVNTVWEDFNIRLELNGIPVISTGKEEEAWQELPALEMEKEGSYLLEKGEIYLSCGRKENDYSLGLVLNARQTDLFHFLYGYFYVVAAMLLLLIPMLLLFLRLSRKYLSRPVEQLMECAGEIEKGNLGVQIENNTGSLEFEYLREAMNRMSRQLKYQFDHIYEEELALQDARIMALQSHINPHFLNNTLEIINWEARLGENEKVSRMIEALSTLMDAAVDRKGLPEVLLSQEMIYVNAYLYIISQRLGKRLEVKKEIPQEIMDRKVPRLILQPIIENAIEHGIMPRGSGRVELRGRQEGKYLYLEIINDGVFTKEDEEKVARLLSPDYDARKESSASLGIANVNQRLRILYGDSCGLSITRYREEETISTLTILVLD